MKYWKDTSTKNGFLILEDSSRYISYNQSFITMWYKLKASYDTRNDEAEQAMYKMYSNVLAKGWKLSGEDEVNYQRLHKLYWRVHSPSASAIYSTIYGTSIGTPVLTITSTSTSGLYSPFFVPKRKTWMTKEQFDAYKGDKSGMAIIDYAVIKWKPKQAKSLFTKTHTVKWVDPKYAPKVENVRVDLDQYPF